MSQLFGSLAALMRRLGSVVQAGPANTTVRITTARITQAILNLLLSIVLVSLRAIGLSHASPLQRHDPRHTFGRGDIPSRPVSIHRDTPLSTPPPPRHPMSTIRTLTGAPSR